MKKEVLEQIDGFQDIRREIVAARKYGSDFIQEKGRVQQFIQMLHPKKLAMRVDGIIDETPSTRTLRLVPEQAFLPPFIAGQYITVFVTVGGVKTARPYSISSPPNQRGYYAITVRRIPGGLVSAYLVDRIKKGDKMEISGPQGHFYHNPVFQPEKRVLIAGGSGITPFMSMIREASDCGLDHDIRLIYGNRSIEDVIFHKEIDHISSEMANISYTPVIEDPPEGYRGEKGVITTEVIKRVAGRTEDKTFFLCGPPAMYDFCLPELEKLQIPRKRIRKEMYGMPDHIWEFPGWPEDVDGSDFFTVRVNGGESVQARAADPLIKSLENKGVSVPCNCRSGECSMCRVRIASGHVFQPPGVPVRRSDTAFGYVHSCAAFPVSDLEITI